MPATFNGYSTLSRSVSQGKSAASWKTTARSGPGPATGTPPSSTRPDVGVSRPAMRFRIVDLPLPEGPTRQTSSPASTWSDASAIAGTSGAKENETRSRDVLEPGLLGKGLVNLFAQFPEIQLTYFEVFFAAIRFAEKQQLILPSNDQILMRQ